MKKFFKKITSSVIPVVLLGLISVACEKEIEDLAPMRMFTPAGLIKSVSGVNEVKLTWNPSLYTTQSNGVTYTVEVAADTLFETPVLLTVETDTSGVVFTDDQLEVRKNYFARIKSNALGDRPESKWVTSNSFRIRGEQIFLPMESSDIIDVAAILKWKKTAGLTKLVLRPETGNPIEVTLTAADVEAAQKMVDKLKPSTTYTAEIYANNVSKGITTFTTKTSTVGANVIDLTDIAGRPSVLQDTLNQIASGSTVVLKRGMTYEISSTTNLDRSVTIVSENSFNPNKAVIYFTSNFNIVEGSVIDSLVFKNVVMRGSDYSGKYVFNISKASTIGKIKFESSHAEIFRGLTRLTAAGIKINNYIITNSVVDSLSNYGILTIDHAGAIVDNIHFKNSTFYKIERGMTSKSSSTSILIENSTFNEVPEATRYLIDYSSNNVTGGIQVKNSIFGVGKSVSGDTGVKGIRAGSGTLVSSSGSYVTSDYVSTGNAIPGLMVYSGTIFDLFQAPRTGDFTIKDANFAGAASAGDPRWRQ